MRADQVRVERSAAAVVVRLSGEHDIATAEAVRRAIASAGDTPAVVDLTATTFVDSSLLRTLYEAHCAASRAGRAFALAIDSSSAAVDRAFRLTGLLGFFSVHESADAALASLSESASE